MLSSQKTLAFWLLIVISALLIFQVYEQKKQKVVKDFDYPKFLVALEKGHVDSVTFNEDSKEIKGTIKKEFSEQYGKGTEFAIKGNTGTEGFKLARKYNITPKYTTSENSIFMTIFINWLPLIIIIAMFIFFIRQVQAGGGKAFNFGKSKARLFSPEQKRISFKDVAGLDEAKEDLEEVVEFLKNPKKFSRLGGKIPKGILLVGPPGTGKTLLARAVAGEAGVPFLTISGSDFVEMFVGVGASRVRDLFDQGKKQAPCIIFMDEIDAVGRHRGAGMGGGHDEREQTLNQLLVEMDGFESSKGVILVAATNRPDVLDPALLRPGRFDRRVIVNKPDIKGREEILKVHVKEVPLTSDVNLKTVALGTPGFSGADIANLVNEAALLAARLNKHKVDMSDFERAKDKVLMGSERKSMVLTPEDRKITAYHEAGHTLVGKSLSHLDPIHKVTIIPRGMALGLTQTIQEKEMLNLSKKKAVNLLAFLFGGRAAEEIVFDDYTTGASDDIKKATGLARSMVCEWGMSDLGPVALEENEGPVFLGLQQQKNKHYSDAKAEEIDRLINVFLNNAYEVAKKILLEKRKVLDNLSEALLKLETINGNEIDMICEGKTLADVEKLRVSLEEKRQKENQKHKKEMELAEAKKKEEEKKKLKKSQKNSLGDPDPITT